MAEPTLIERWAHGNLILQIALGIVVGIVLALVKPDWAIAAGLLGTLFVQALKAVAPVLVFILVASAIANRSAGGGRQLRPIIGLYLIGTFGAAFVAVILSFAFPATLTLDLAGATASPPEGIAEVLLEVLGKLFANPVTALAEGNFLGLLVWGAALGITLHSARESTRNMLADLTDAITRIVRVVIRLAPFGIFGLVAASIATDGLSALANYAHVLTLLLSAMLVIALVVNPLIVWLATSRNPYPLVFTALRESGITAFFTRSSAANIPVNLALCERLGLPRDTYAVSVPLGATINMAGAAITITVMTLAAANSLNIAVDFPTALLLSLVAALSACGASGVAGGSLLLIPLACSLFGIPENIALQVVAAGFVISVLQDSAETALNSSTDVVFTAAIAARAAAAEPQSEADVTA